MALDNSLTTQPVSKLVRRLAVPASVGFFFNTMFNVVDTYYGGLLSTDALAALSLSFPIFFIVIALGMGMGTGATALIASALGAGDREEAGLLAAQTLAFGLILGVVLTVVGLVAAPFLFTVLGARGAYLDMALQYMNVIFGGGVFFMLVFTLNALLNSQGNTKTFRNYLIIAFTLNLVLDPWFMYGGLGLPAMGFAGIALATVLVHVYGCFHLGWRVKHGGLLSGRFPSQLRPRARVMWRIARQGLPASINVATIGLGIFIITWFISRFGQEGVAAYGIAIRIEQMVLMPSIGLNVATLSIVAQNHGAGLLDRVRSTGRAALTFGGWLTAGGMILMLALAGPLMGFFTTNRNIVDIGATYLRIDALVLYAYVVLSVSVATLQGLKRPMFALWIGLYRQILAPVLVFHLLSQTLGWGLTGIWWGIFLVTWSAALIAFIRARKAVAA